MYFIKINPKMYINLANISEFGLVKTDQGEVVQFLSPGRVLTSCDPSYTKTVWAELQDVAGRQPNNGNQADP
ncbi:MAG: hypothetical protein GY797_10560 [Deltaproteobacteria bacterium]|nr:hypothetical protein [Deltaproteobacteria bacterium]